jgi:hypothetical protein
VVEIKEDPIKKEAQRKELLKKIISEQFKIGSYVYASYLKPIYVKNIHMDKPRGILDRVFNCSPPENDVYLGEFAYFGSDNKVSINGDPAIFKEVAEKLEANGFKVTIYY